MAHIYTVNGLTPVLGENVYVAPTAAITGDVKLDDGASAFYGVSARGDSAPIRVGKNSNLQDNVVLHADPGFPCTVGENVSVGHNAVVHGCTVEDGCIVGMSATIMNGAVVGANSLIAAGAVVLEGTIIPPGSLVAGVPGKVRKQLSEEEQEGLLKNAKTYTQLAAQHAEANGGN